MGLKLDGARSLIGVDEVGRGSLAGPLLVVAARTTAELPAGLKDSKLLSKRQREEILNKLSICCDFGEGWVSAAQIDRIGLAESLRLGVSRALKNINAQADEEIILDGNVNYLAKEFTNGSVMVGADNLVPIVSAASIYAKVTRDLYMAGLAQKYPLYHFESHVGYGTKAHIEALAAYGAIESVHRVSYAPVAKLLEAA